MQSKTYKTFLRSLKDSVINAPTNGRIMRAIRKAEYALEMARKNINRHFYIYTTVRDGQGFNTDADVPSYQPLLNYINESVRIFKVRDEITTEYTNYFGHHDPDGGEQNRVMKIHPADAGAFLTSLAAELPELPPNEEWLAYTSSILSNATIQLGSLAE